MPKLRKSPEDQREANLKKFFKKALLDREWSVKHLAELLGVDAANVSRTINHPMKCEIKTLLRVSDKLGVNLLNPEI